MVCEEWERSGGRKGEDWRTVEGRRRSLALFTSRVTTSLHNHTPPDPHTNQHAGEEAGFSGKGKGSGETLERRGIKNGREDELEGHKKGESMWKNMNDSRALYYQRINVNPIMLMYYQTK